MLASVFPPRAFPAQRYSGGTGRFLGIALARSICWRRQEPTVARTCCNMDELCIETEKLVPFVSFSFFLVPISSPTSAEQDSVSTVPKRHVQPTMGREVMRQDA